MGAISSSAGFWYGMAYQRPQQLLKAFWELVARQYGVVSRAQLLALGFSSQAIKRRVANGRLHPVRRGVYAVGRPELTGHGVWMAAILSCGEGAVLSHGSAAALWGIGDEQRGVIEISVPASVERRGPGMLVHRRTRLSTTDVTEHERIPVTSPALTLIDLASRLSMRKLEAAVNAADKHDRIDPEALRAALDQHKGRHGVAALRVLLDRLTFVLTDSELERWFLPLVRAAGLPKPSTGENVNGFDVDFHWPDLGLVVETDGLRYHRTPAQQARDRLRDQTHTAAGLTPLRFTHAQIRYEPAHVRVTLTRVARRLGAPQTPEDFGTATGPEGRRSR